MVEYRGSLEGGLTVVLAVERPDTGGHVRQGATVLCPRWPSRVIQPWSQSGRLHGVGSSSWNAAAGGVPMGFVKQLLLGGVGRAWRRGAWRR